jgi:hypothetical protein
MKTADVRTVVRIPLGDIAADVAQMHGIRLQLALVKIDGNSLVLEFGGAGKLEGSGVTPAGGPGEHRATSSDATLEPMSQSKNLSAPSPPTRRTRRAGRRNRMKTRSWNVVTKTTNSHGQTVTIYEPFVKALRGMSGPRRAKEKAVSEILKANGNKPGPESVKYYLENTLEYLAKESSR